MKVGRYLGLIVILMSSLLTASAAHQEDAITVIKTDDGVMLVWNLPDLHFTIEIKGTDVRPLNSPESVFFNVDGKVLQVQSVAVNEFMKDAERTKKDDKSILVAHRDWESQFIESSLLGKKLTVETVPQKLSNGSEGLLWKFAMPKMPEMTNTTAKAQIYLTVVSGAHVILLNGVVEGETVESAVQNFLLETISTLKVSPKPINLRELQESIRKGN
jgi:hypothetical protein